MKGVIYRLECVDSGRFYIGSTIHTLAYRLKKHRSTSKEPDKMRSPLYTHFTEIGWDKARMVLVREVEFETRSDLLALEREEIDKHIGGELCLNHNRSVITDAEKREMDRQHGKRRRQQYPDRERERVAEWRRNNPDKYALQVARSVEQQRRKRTTPL
jgi:hypothetical protein